MNEQTNEEFEDWQMVPWLVGLGLRLERLDGTSPPEIRQIIRILRNLERDHEAMNRLRSDKGCLQWAFGTWGHTVDFDVLRMNPRVEDPADAVLGKQESSDD